MTSRSPARGTTPRWGLRTLAFLALAAVSVLVSNVMYARGVDDYVLFTFAGLVLGFGGAAVCTVRGLRSWRGPRL